MPTGPPPQAVLDQRWLWSLLMLLLGLTFVMRLIGLDIAGALLTGLMLCFGIIMTRDGMQEMAKYALVYAVLCGLNFFFDILPLITELGGRVTRAKEPVGAVKDDNGVRQTTYMLTTKVTPFFDAKQGLVYNVQSLAVILAPVCMALGVYLSVSAHNELYRNSLTFTAQDFGTFEDVAAVQSQQQHQTIGTPQPGFSMDNAGPGHRLSDDNPDGVPGAGLGVGTSPSGTVSGRSTPGSHQSSENLGRFQGKGYKLG